MEVVREVIEDELHIDIPIAGLAKDDRHRTNELLYGFPPKVIGMKTDSELFRLLTHIQDEVHRFAITFHRDKRSKEALMKAFKTVKKMRESDVESLAEVVGRQKAELLREYFDSKKQ